MLHCIRNVEYNLLIPFSCEQKGKYYLVKCKGYSLKGSHYYEELQFKRIPKYPLLCQWLQLSCNYVDQSLHNAYSTYCTICQRHSFTSDLYVFIPDAHVQSIHLRFEVSDSNYLLKHLGCLLPPCYYHQFVILFHLE